MSGSLFASLRPKKAGGMRYFAFGKTRQWFYVEWGGDGWMIHLFGLGLRANFKVWRIR